MNKLLTRIARIVLVGGGIASALALTLISLYAITQGDVNLPGALTIATMGLLYAIAALSVLGDG